MKKDYPRLRQQGPRYYYDHGGKPRRWEPLGKDWDRVMVRYRELKGGTKHAPGNTVGWLIDRFLATRTEIAANTLKTYRVSAEHIRRVFAHCPLAELRRGHVIQFLDHHPHKQAARNAVIFLQMCCNFALDRELMAVNPLVKIPLGKKAKRERYLTDSEFLAIRANLKPVFQVAADLAYLLGLRVSGVVTLRFSHIRDGVLSFHPPKSKKPITYQLSDEVKAVIERARTLPGAVRGLTVICNRRGLPMSAIYVSQAFTAAARKAGIHDARFHDIRAKSASDEASTAQGRLGHTDARTTDGYLRKPQVVRPIKGVV